MLIIFYDKNYQRIKKLLLQIVLFKLCVRLCCGVDNVVWPQIILTKIRGCTVIIYV